MIRRKLVSLLLATTMIAGVVTGCGEKEEGSADGKGSVYYLSFKPEQTDQWKAIAAKYTEQTGIEVKVQTAASGTYEQTLKSEIAKKDAPTLFQINGPVGYQSWKDYCMDLSGTNLYSWLKDKDMAVTDGDGVYGIPYVVEGYGIIYNQEIMDKYFAVFVLPTLLAFTVFFIIPFIMGIVLSFCKFTTVTNARFVGFSNYIRAFSNADFINALGFTTKFTIVSVITINIIAFAIAYGLTRGIKGTNFFRTTFFMPNLIGGIVLGYIWQLMINAVLANFDVTITSDAKYGFWGLVILMNWQLIGYMMIIYIAAIQNIPGELIEAAKIDGATKTQTMFKVIIPMAMPSITICLFLSLTNAFKLFDQNLALTAGAPSRKTAGLALDIYTTFYNRNGWEGVGQAKAVVFFIIVGIVSMLQLYITRKREVEE